MDPARAVVARLSASVTEHWSWAASCARVPQIRDLFVELSASVAQVRLTITLQDGEERFGGLSRELGALAEGATPPVSCAVPLSAQAMAQVDERREAVCVISVEDVESVSWLGWSDPCTSLLETYGSGSVTRAGLPSTRATRPTCRS